MKITIKKTTLLISFITFFQLSANIPVRDKDSTSLSLLTEEHTQQPLYEQRLEKNKKFFYQTLFYSGFCKTLAPSVFSFILAHCFMNEGIVNDQQAQLYPSLAVLMETLNKLEKILPLIGLIPFFKHSTYDKSILLDKRIVTSYLKGVLTGLIPLLLSSSFIAHKIVKEMLKKNHSTGRTLRAKE